MLSLLMLGPLLVALAHEFQTSVAVVGQLGAFGGAVLGGVALALGGFPFVGLFCLAVAVIAPVVLRLTVRESAAFLAQTTLRRGTATTE
jgi:predicted MFS family arabinose efflux permease